MKGMSNKDKIRRALLSGISFNRSEASRVFGIDEHNFRKYIRELRKEGIKIDAVEEHRIGRSYEMRYSADSNAYVVSLLNNAIQRAYTSAAMRGKITKEDKVVESQIKAVIEEVREFCDAYRTNWKSECIPASHSQEECADIVIAALTLCSLVGTTGEMIYAKMLYNDTRDR